MKVMSEINKINHPPKKLYKKINKAKSCLFEMIYKIEKLLANLPRRSRKKTKVNKIIDEKEDITTNIKGIHRIIRV
jgi:hypothetical protein